MLSFWLDYSRFATETTVASLLLSMGLIRRNRFWLRLVASLFGIFLLSLAAAAIPIPLQNSPVWNGLVYFALSLLPMAALYLLYQGTFWDRLFSFINGAMLRMCARKVFEALLYLITHSDTYNGLLEKGQALRYVLYYGVLTLLYLGAWLVFGRAFRKGKTHNDRHVLIIYLFMMAINLVLNRLEPVLEQMEPAYYVELVLCEAAYSLLMLLLQFVLFRLLQKQEEAVTARELWRMDRQQYEQMKENIETINIKCHDLRHHIREIQKNAAGQDSAYLEEVAKSISIYDSMAKTGNDALDVVLTEKKLRAEAAHIQMTVMADGAAIRRIGETDVYALFGNLLDNAIEYESTVPDPAKRFISLVVEERMGCASIHVENWCEKYVHFENGLPETTKSDKSLHGYGLKSVRRIVEQNGGTLSIFCEDGLFQVHILFPAQ